MKLLRLQTGDWWVGSGHTHCFVWLVQLLNIVWVHCPHTHTYNLIIWKKNKTKQNTEDSLTLLVGLSRGHPCWQIRDPLSICHQPHLPNCIMASLSPSLLVVFAQPSGPQDLFSPLLWKNYLCFLSGVLWLFCFSMYFPPFILRCPSKLPRADQGPHSLFVYL